MTGTYKPARARRPPWRRWLPAVVVAFALGVVTHAWLRPVPPRASTAGSASTVDGLRVVDGVPTGFAATAHGAGDAAARFETAISRAGSLPRAGATALLRRLYPDASDDDLTQLLPTLPRPDGAAIWQSTVVRVWAERSTDPTVLSAGATVRVQTLVVSLFGPATDGNTAASSAGLAGMWTVHDLTMRWTSGGWRLAAAQTPVPAPPPDIAGTTRDGSPRDPQLLARVLGPDSWGP